MFPFLQAAWFLCWIMVVIGVLRWFHNAAEFNDYFEAVELADSGRHALETSVLDQPNSRAS